MKVENYENILFSETNFVMQSDSGFISWNMPDSVFGHEIVEEVISKGSILQRMESLLKKYTNITISMNMFHVYDYISMWVPKYRKFITYLICLIELIFPFLIFELFSHFYFSIELNFKRMCSSTAILANKGHQVAKLCFAIYLSSTNQRKMTGTKRRPKEGDAHTHLHRVRKTCGSESEGVQNRGAWPLCPPLWQVRPLTSTDKCFCTDLLRFPKMQICPAVTPSQPSGRLYSICSAKLIFVLTWSIQNFVLFWSSS